MIIMKKWFRKLVSFCLILALAAACVPASVQAEGLESFAVGEFKEDVEVPSDKGGMIYRFVPDETQTYAFAGKVYSNTYLELSVLAGYEEIACFTNDESEGRTVVCFFEAEAGKEYLLNVVAMSWLGYDTCITDLWLEIPCTPEEIYFSDGYLTGSVGDEFDLQLQFEPLWAIPEACVWESSNPSVATVDQNGHVVMLSNGYADVYATLESGLTAYCWVEVVSLEAVEFDYPFKTGYVGKSETLQYSFEPYGTSDTVTVTSSDPAVAEVWYDENWETWNVTYHTLGTATLTVTTAGGLFGTCQVTVKAMNTIYLGDTITVTVQPGDRLSYIFTPEESAEYAFCSEERVGLFGFGDGWYSDEGDTAMLEAGESYTLSVWNEDRTELTCTLRLEKAVPVEYMEIKGIHSMYVGDKIKYYNLEITRYPVWAHDESIDWVSSDEGIVEIFENGDIHAVAEGTAIITFTAEGGATASVPVTVATPEELQCGESRTITLGYPDSVKYTFTPKENGEYAFYMKEGEFIETEQTEYGASGYTTDFQLSILCDDSQQRNVRDYVLISCQMEAGKTYELRASNYWGEGIEITGTVLH